LAPELAKFDYETHDEICSLAYNSMERYFESGGSFYRIMWNRLEARCKHSATLFHNAFLRFHHPASQPMAQCAGAHKFEKYGFA
jgi:hypothetical protein